ncbi:MAG: hypothetical protein ABID04_01620, partial [Patescibacteria group bacterium]
MSELVGKGPVESDKQREAVELVKRFIQLGIAVGQDPSEVGDLLDNISGGQARALRVDADTVRAIAITLRD